MVYAIACQVLYDTIMSDEQKQADLKTRKDRYFFEKNKVVELIMKARKKGRMKEVIEKSLRHEGFEGDMHNLKAEVAGANGTSTLMKLKAVTDQGVDCWQYFSEDEFKKRFL